MKPLDSFAGASLWWHRLGPMSRKYELLGDDGELYGRLSFEGIFGSLGQAEVDGLRLDLRWSILFRRGVRIGNSDTKERIGELRLGLLDRGEFSFASGRRYRFVKNLVWSKCTVTDDLGDIQVTMTPSAFGSRVKVVLGTRLASRQELPVMVAATRYALVMMSQEAGAAAAGG